MSLSSSTNSLPYSTDKGGYSTHDTLILLGIGFCATSVSILIIVLCECLCCRRRRRGAGGTVVYVAARPFFLHDGAATVDGAGLSPSAVAALPSLVYHRGLAAGSGGAGGDGSSRGGWAQCAVCLSLVQEGEVVRRLPACMHLFHVCCIDMWLRSHSTCPLCRATVEPTKAASSKEQALPFIVRSISTSKGNEQSIEVVVHGIKRPKQMGEERRVAQAGRTIEGHFYLGDAGYTNGPGFLTPFRSTRYHLKEWVLSQQQPKTPKELYNLCHSRARNVVERTFGLWKKKWAILREESFFGIKDQIQIINACCVLHNFARDRQHHMDDLLLTEVDSEIADMPNEPLDEPNLIRTVQVTIEWNNFGDLFAKYLVRHLMAESKAKRGSRVYLTWTAEMDSALLAVLVEHHNNGDHAQNGWKPHVYNAAIKHIFEKCSVIITKDNISSRCKIFDKHYEVISKILSQSGFGWDWDNNKLQIDSEEVWTKYVEANKGAACYKTKVVRNWDAISTIYSKDHATGEGAMTGAEIAEEPAVEGNEQSPDLPQKRQRTGEAILCMLGDMKISFHDAMKTSEPLQLPQVTPPAEILAALDMIPNLARSDKLRSYGKLILSERLFQALMELPMELRKEWLLMLE
ncbi:hypothetical protein EJB05_25058, partial [Eragrostis curvula]